VMAVRNFSDAVKMLEYANRDNDRHELTALNSAAMDHFKGSFDFDDASIEWLGYDIWFLGGWSLILNGVFFKPDLFAKWIDCLNDNGLFENKDYLDAFLEDYKVY